ncbi:hypothetical protein K435DRAFT_798298 [Dendrothele bispora CBS 962.96]|uniref:Uncharacterized protein n=1 Tax=Dendrothele bispora (strain CBS 962.96) TaxID=1314807 RepID=A0A4S8LZM7_DENBC|nr:hypothetical protein K435DRAFT_798298 [Dendrothele bispora CBS 962.96]
MCCDPANDQNESPVEVVDAQEMLTQDPFLLKMVNPFLDVEVEDSSGEETPELNKTRGDEWDKHGYDAQENGGMRMKSKITDRRETSALHGYSVGKFEPTCTHTRGKPYPCGGYG